MTTSQASRWPVTKLEKIVTQKNINYDIIIFHSYSAFHIMFQYALHYFPWSLGQHHSCNLCSLFIQHTALSYQCAFEPFSNTITTSSLPCRHLYSWVKEKQLHLSVLLKDTSTTVTARIGTLILTTRPSEYKSDALTHSTMAFTCLEGKNILQINDKIYNIWHILR